MSPDTGRGRRDLWCVSNGTAELSAGLLLFAECRAEHNAA